MGHGRHVSGSSYPVPEAPAPVADYNVATNPELNPDCSCNYFVAGTFDGKPYYHNPDKGFYLWYELLDDVWRITITLGFELGKNWVGHEYLEGNYEPAGGAVGTAVVSAGPH